MGDTLISSLQQGRDIASRAPGSPLLEPLRQRLQQLPHSPNTDTPLADSTPTLPPPERTAEGSLLAPPQQPDEIGRLGGYRILEELGQGGMGVVFKAEDPKLKRLVALKVMRPYLAADPAARQRFLREAQSMAALRHDNIVTIYQVDEDDGVPFLAMEFLKGMPLDQWLAGGRKPSVAQVLKLGREIAQGLALPHTIRSLIHRGCEARQHLVGVAVLLPSPLYSGERGWG